ncbi:MULTISPECIES: WPE palindromic element domain-containing protein [unclassified Wolbachia]|nr:WPE palindromic element domain-containing protein [Wolbachia endosymbiont (group A) of Apoderus coryli]
MGHQWGVIPVPRHWDPAFDRKCCIVHNQFFWIPVSSTGMTPS